MLIKNLGCTRAPVLVALALGLGPAEPRAIGFGLAASLLARAALPEPFEID
jgi:hypothetical protein